MSDAGVGQFWSKCGTGLSISAKYCSECGEEVVASSALADDRPVNAQARHRCFGWMKSMVGRTRALRWAAALVVAASFGFSPNAAVGAEPQIAAGGGSAYHSCVLAPAGQVSCWGSNQYGQLGSASSAGTVNPNPTPTVTEAIANADQLVVGGQHTCAILASGDVKCWGANYSGQLGNGALESSSSPNSTPVIVTGVSGAVKLASGEGHTCALLHDGTVKCWGYNYFGQLGNSANQGTYRPNSVPVAVVGISNAIGITAGSDHTCALLSDGTIKCWGNNNFGQLGTATNEGQSVPNPIPTNVASMSDATQIMAGTRHSCALLNSREVACWGANYHGELGSKLHNWTYMPNSTPARVEGLHDVLQIGGGGEHSCAFITTGQLKCWGLNVVGELGIPSSSGPGGFGSTPEEVQGIDLNPARPTITLTPKSINPERDASVEWAATARFNYTCKLDSSPETPCTSPWARSSLSEGQHSLTVTAVTGGLVSDPAVVTWTIDTTAPAAPSMTSKPSSLSSVASPSFSFTGEPQATFSCSIDNSTFSACSNPVSVSTLREGSHSLKVKQTDQAGNTGSAASYSWTIDLTPPAIPVLSNTPASLTNTASASIGFTAATDKTFQCSVDGGAFSSCRSPLRLSGLSEGRHSVVVQHSDPAGNTSSSTASWTVDTTIPSLNASAFGGKIKTSTQTSYYLSVNPDASGIAKVEYTTASRAPAMNARNVASKTVAYASPVVFVTSSKIMFIRIQDGAGNWSRWYIG